MLDRIEVNVIHVPCKIVVVADPVSPEAGLPNPAFALARAAGRNNPILSVSNGRRQSASFKVKKNVSPATRLQQ